MGPRSSVSYKLENINSEAVLAVIALHGNARNITSGLFDRYMQKNIPIQSRPTEDITKPNNKLANDFRGYIVDQVTSYMFGNEVMYNVDKVSYEGQDATYEAFASHLESFNTENEVSDLDAETCTYMSASGYAARLFYLEENTDAEAEFPTTLKAMVLPAWETVFVYDGLARTHAIRYQVVMVEDEERIYATVYDATNLTRFEPNDDGELVQVEQKPHGFTQIPIALFQNNAQETCDFEKVEPLIDAYDVVTSDAVNEVESFAHAYLALDGVEMDEAEATKAKKTGVLVFPPRDQGEGASKGAYFITKNVNDSFLENTKRSLVADIHKFSASANMADESFSGGAQSGEARKWKMQDLESRAGKKQRKFAKGLREQFRILCSNWKVQTDGVDFRKVSFKFSRNVPQDLSYLADFASKMVGIISDETLYDNLNGVVNDSQYEIELKRQEQAAYGNILPSVSDETEMVD